MAARHEKKQEGAIAEWETQAEASLRFFDLDLSRCFQTKPLLAPELRRYCFKFLVTVPEKIQSRE